MVFIGMGRENMGNTKKVLFRGKHKDLVNGESYTYEHFAKVAGVGYKCMYSRLYGKKFVTENDLRPLKTKHIGKSWNPNWNAETDKTYTRFETALEQISQNWLRRSL